MPRSRVLAACAVPVVALVAVAGLAPLPFAIAQPGTTADVLGKDKDFQQWRATHPDSFVPRTQARRRAGSTHARGAAAATA